MSVGSLIDVNAGSIAGSIISITINLIKKNLLRHAYKLVSEARMGSTSPPAPQNSSRQDQKNLPGWLALAHISNVPSRKKAYNSIETNFIWLREFWAREIRHATKPKITQSASHKVLENQTAQETWPFECLFICNYESEVSAIKSSSKLPAFIPLPYTVRQAWASSGLSCKPSMCSNLAKCRWLIIQHQLKPSKHTTPAR